MPFIYSMEKEKNIGYEIHTLDNMIGRMISSCRSRLTPQGDLTAMQCWIIGFLYDHMDKDVFQKDIETEFHIARSTASGILSLMEKKGYILRKSHPSDARLKHLVLTQNGIDLQKSIIESIHTTERKLENGISAEDLETFYRILDQIRKNTEADD